MVFCLVCTHFLTHLVIDLLLITFTQVSDLFLLPAFSKYPPSWHLLTLADQFSLLFMRQKCIYLPRFPINYATSSLFFHMSKNQIHLLMSDSVTCHHPLFLFCVYTSYIFFLNGWCISVCCAAIDVPSLCIPCLFLHLIPLLWVWIDVILICSFLKLAIFLISAFLWSRICSW